MAATDGGKFGGASIGALLSAKKKKQVAPDYTPYENVDPTKVTASAIKGNMQNSGAIEELLARGNAFSQSQNLSLLETAMPGWSKMTKSFMDTSDGGLYSMPKEVEANLARIASERGVSAGTRGQFNDYSMLRDMGVNMLDWGSQRLQQMGAIASISKVNPMSVMSFYTSPEAAVNVAIDNNTKQWQGQNAHNNAVAAAKNWNNANKWDSYAQALTYVGGVVDEAYEGVTGWFSLGGGGTGTSAGSMTGKGGSGAGASGGAGAAMCWVAREVYGADNPKWQRFRDWMVSRAPEWVRDVYASEGPDAADELRDDPIAKATMRGLMDRILDCDAAAMEGGV